MSPRRGQRPASGPALSHPGLIALAFLAPALVSLAVLRIVPAGQALVESFYAESLLRGGRVFSGLGNYTDLLSNKDFRQAVGVTLLFTVLVNPIQVVVAFLLAVLFTQKAAGAKLWRTLVILPIATPPAVSAVIWSVIYRPDGLANGLLERLGLPAQPFLLPLVRRPLAFVLVADTVSNLLVFAPVRILTKGGPNGNSNLLMYDVYTRAYAIGDIHVAHAEVVVLVALTIVIVAAQFRLLRGDQ